MLKEDADNCVSYYKNRKCVILEEISKRSLGTSLLTLGAHAQRGLL